MRIVARVSFTSNGSRPLRWIVSRMSLLIGPRIFSTACGKVIPCTGWPSICVIISPGFSPARAAGVSSIGETTLTRPFSIETSMPSPPNSPRVWTFMSSKFFVFR